MQGQCFAKVFLKAFDGNYTISILFIAFPSHTLQNCYKMHIIELNFNNKTIAEKSKIRMGKKEENTTRTIMKHF